MKWKNEYSLGIQEIDNQHKQLLHSFSVIEDAINLNPGREWASIHYSIVELQHLARMHFSFEESLMRLFGYPKTKEHSSEHEYFFVKIREIESHSIRNSMELEMLEFLRVWLTKHILGIDRDYARHILSGAVIVREPASGIGQQDE